jgi:hypothetical protein
MKLTNRAIHRDLAYFYVGLLIAFSFSGIILNHRQTWYPMEYTYESKPISLEISEKEPTKEDLQPLINEKGWTYQSHRQRGNSLRIDLTDGGIIEINTESGEGSLEYRRKVPVLGHTMYLHKTTDKFWIWYSDIFGAAMIIIAVTGMLIPLGKNGFKQRGWKLMVAGLIFPLIFLFFLG